MEKTPVKVFFVKSENGEIDAVMPFELGTNDPMTMTVYSHIGQHSSCHALWVEEQIKAKPEEYKDLLDELNNQIGYDVEVLTRFDYPSSYLQRAGNTLKQTEKIIMNLLYVVPKEMPKQEDYNND